MAEQPKEPQAPAGANEGEGSRTADRSYREGVRHTLEGRDVAADAEAARREVEAHPDEFRRAEEEGKARSAGEAPGDLRPAGADRELQEPEDA